MTTDTQGREDPLGSEVTDEMVERAVAAWINWETANPEDGVHGYMRAALVAALKAERSEGGSHD